MKNIAVIGLGVMGLPMAINLVSKGLDVIGVDLSETACDALVQAGGQASSLQDLAFDDREAIITMLPEGRHVMMVYEEAVLPRARVGTLLIDSSTIDIETTRQLSAKAAHNRLHMIDAPVSGGPEAAGMGKLSFMIGGNEEACRLATPLLEQMGTKMQNFGESGSGQAAKACHNMICGITAIAVCEGYALATALGLDVGRFHALCKGAAAQSWILENRCPVPDIVPDAPSNNDYAPGFAAKRLAKDLRLAQMAAEARGQPTPFGAEAARKYTEFAENGGGELDFSAYFKKLRPNI